MNITDLKNSFFALKKFDNTPSVNYKNYDLRQILDIYGDVLIVSLA